MTYAAYALPVLVVLVVALIVRCIVLVFGPIDHGGDLG